MSRPTSELFALVRANAPGEVARVGAKASLEGDRLHAEDRVLPVTGPGPIPDGHVLTSANPRYKVLRNRVEAVHQSRPMSAKEREAAARQRRGEAYPAVGNQLDAIVKGFDALRRAGIALPAETVAWVDSCLAVKAGS